MKKILILEDEIEIGQTLQYILEREGYEADHHSSGDEAVQAALEKDYDLILLDIMLKQQSVDTTITNGLEAARKISQQKSTPYIFLTSRAESFDVMVGLDLGAEDYITKPYDITELLARIRAVLRRHDRTNAGINTGILESGPLKVNLLSHKVWVDGIEVKLPNQQFELLHYLMEHKNEIVSKDELYKNIWGYEPYAAMGTNTLEVNIKRLRNSIGSQLIKTIRGKGYVLEAD
ncbi:response regulator transcription factor [Cytobacillus oceanisediminis]|uniref:response regulator transcription factor n=1 Tax=Cytobacillus oceanisediminis TaxID=665099 RepID=UPI001FB4C404|nr:response regulator transcription factor [Cytobacillus oceanisediminis]UOE58195.1 response regulator transcription factor [Cytobacillus oceanisediminis]